MGEIVMGFWVSMGTIIIIIIFLIFVKFIKN